MSTNSENCTNQSDSTSLNASPHGCFLIPLIQLHVGHYLDAATYYNYHYQLFDWFKLSTISTSCTSAVTASAQKSDTTVNKESNDNSGTKDKEKQDEHNTNSKDNENKNDENDSDKDCNTIDVNLIYKCLDFMKHNSNINYAQAIVAVFYNKCNNWNQTLKHTDYFNKKIDKDSILKFNNTQQAIEIVAKYEYERERIIKDVSKFENPFALQLQGYRSASVLSFFAGLLEYDKNIRILNYTNNNNKNKNKNNNKDIKKSDGDPTTTSTITKADAESEIKTQKLCSKADTNDKDKDNDNDNDNDEEEELEDIDVEPIDKTNSHKSNRNSNMYNGSSVAGGTIGGSNDDTDDDTSDDSDDSDESNDNSNGSGSGRKKKKSQKEWIEEEMMQACNAFNTIIVKICLEYTHLKINDFLANSNRTALSYACGKRDFDTVKYLLTKYSDSIDVNLVSDVNDRYNYHYTPLGHAIGVSGADIKLIKLLIKHGANVNAKFRDGITPLMVAIKSGTCLTSQCLIEHGANLNDVDNTGKTALMRLIPNGNKRTFDLLLNKGIDINIKDNKGQTALILSTIHNFDYFVERLLSKSEEIGDVCQYVDTRDNNGKSAIDYTYRGRKCYELLIECGSQNETKRRRLNK